MLLLKSHLLGAIINIIFPCIIGVVITMILLHFNDTLQEIKNNTKKKF